MDASNSAYKQAESARLQLERLQAGDTTVRFILLSKRITNARSFLGS